MLTRLWDALRSLPRPAPDFTSSREALTPRRRLIRFAGEAIIVGLAVAPLLGGPLGFDYMYVFRGDVLRGQIVEILNPWPFIWLVYPFAYLPPALGQTLWGLVQALGYIYALRKFGGSALWFALSLPCVWNFTQGQSEGFNGLGLALGMASSPWLGGVGIFLLSLKPQFGALAILWILWHRRDWRLLVVPLLAYAISVAVWGFWFDDWFRQSILRVASVRQEEIINIGFFPYALILLPLILYLRDLRPASLVLGLSLPYFALYSFGAVLTMRWRSRWSVPILVIGGWLVIAVNIAQWPGFPAFQVMSLVPIAMLVAETVEKVRARRSALPAIEDAPASAP